VDRRVHGGYHEGERECTKRGDDSSALIRYNWSALIFQYASDMDEIHGLGAAISQAGTGGASVKGGNWKIFEAMLDESGATQKLNTQVSRDDPPVTGPATPGNLLQVEAQPTTALPVA